MDVIALLKNAWPFLLVAAPGLFALIKWVEGAQRGGRKDRADLIRIAQDAAAGVIGHLEREAAELRKRVDDLEGELNKLRKDHHEMMVSKDAKITFLEAEVQRWRSYAESYERTLEQNGIPHAKPEQSMWDAKDQRLVMKSLTTEPPP